MQSKNADSVLPEPVGAAISVSSPAAIAGQPADWAGVGPCVKRRSNHSLTAGCSRSSSGCALEPSMGPKSTARGPGRYSLTAVRR